MTSFLTELRIVAKSLSLNVRVNKPNIIQHNEITNNSDLLLFNLPLEFILSSMLNNSLSQSTSPILRHLIGSEAFLIMGKTRQGWWKTECIPIWLAPSPSLGREVAVSSGDPGHHYNRVLLTTYLLVKLQNIFCFYFVFTFSLNL